MTPKIHSLVRSCLGLIAVFIGNALVTEVGAIIITGANLVLMSTFLFFLVFCYRLYSFQLYQKVGIAIYFSILFAIGIYLCLLRIFICGSPLR